MMVCTVRAATCCADRDVDDGVHVTAATYEGDVDVDFDVDDGMWLRRLQHVVLIVMLMILPVVVMLILVLMMVCTCDDSNMWC